MILNTINGALVSRMMGISCMYKNPKKNLDSRQAMLDNSSLASQNILALFDEIYRISQGVLAPYSKHSSKEL